MKKLIGSTWDNGEGIFELFLPGRSAKDGGNVSFGHQFVDSSL